MDPLRVRLLNNADLRSGARYVLYWAQANRRLDSNHALTFAAGFANRQGLPLLMYEGLTCSHPWASDRFHQFVLEGVPDNEERARELGIGYVFHLRRRKSDPNDAVYRLACEAAAVVTDDFPSYIVPEHNRRVASKIGIPFYVVDASCIVPMATLQKQEWAAYTIRPKIQRALAECLRPVPRLRLQHRHSASILKFHTKVSAANIPNLIAGSEIDHSVAPSRTLRGGRSEALRRLRTFLECNLHRYAKYASKPSERATSQLSAYLHFGHISALEVALAVQEYAERHRLVANEFLEELIVRRELAFNFARYGPDPSRLSALPAWARESLAKHARDARRPTYTAGQFEQARTHDPLWNACQTELLRDGVIHGYYRMYWGKKIIEWSATHQEALDTMIHLNDRYALDGRDPNTYTNILWCFGLHDRAWPERPIFGKIRYMSFDGMKRKTDVDAYIQAQSARPGLVEGQR